jgi:hypothetical protein
MAKGITYRIQRNISNTDEAVLEDLMAILFCQNIWSYLQFENVLDGIS